MNETLNSLHSYAKDFYSKTEFGESNIVGSPLGSWLLLASVASGLNFDNNPELKKRTEDCLHMSVAEAEIAVKEILASYPALNYVAQAWTTPDLTALPAVQKWIESNTLIPHVGSIPSQEVIDEWASTNTNNLIEKFPAEMTEDTMLVIANIIYSKLAWKTKFHAVPTPDSMSNWNIDTVLTATATPYIKFYMDESNDIFAVYEVHASGEHKESVHLITCLSRDLEPAQLMDCLHNVNSLEAVSPNDELLVKLSAGMYVVKEVRRGTSPTVIEVNLPAWEARSKYALLENKGAGYRELVQAFSEGADGKFSSEAKQVAVAKFDKDGFEAAALTTMIMARCAMPQFVEQTVFELNFAKPFVFVSYSDKLPLFSGHICQAKAAE